MTTSKRKDTCTHCQRVRVIRARGLCGSCYNRARKASVEDGVPMPPRERLTPQEYLEASRGPTDQCWPWAGATTSHGYGLVCEDGGRTYAHRWVYEHEVGPIQEGLEIDHLCRVRLCVNPAHLEPVTHGENLRRAVQYRAPQVTRLGHGSCTHGDLDLYVDPSGKRVCRPCRRERTRLWRAAA